MEQVVIRLRDSFAARPAPSGAWLGTAVALAGVIVAVRPLWVALRPVITVVHELGHGLVGLLCGRRFTGVVIHGDMSGHTVTAGRPHGPGLVLTTLAGYPMPALVGAAMITAALAGRGALVLLVTLAALSVALIRSRSVFTVVTVVALLAAVGVLWWSEDVVATSTLAAALGVFLLVGAWRQFGAVARHGDRRDDPGALAAITSLPTLVWKLVMLMLIAAPTWWAGSALVHAL